MNRYVKHHICFLFIKTIFTAIFNFVNSRINVKFQKTDLKILTKLIFTHKYNICVCKYILRTKINV